MSSKPIVIALRSDYHNLSSKLQLLLKSFLNSEIRTKKIIIKINLCDARTPEVGAITHPLFLDALLQYLRSFCSNTEIYVVESDATVVLADEFIRWFGFEPILSRWNAQWINLSKINSIKKILNGLFFKEIELPEIFEDEFFFISLAKLKTNILTKISCVLKNQFGCLPKVEKNEYHPYIHEAIVDINSVLRPHLSLVDGIVAMGGAQGPAFGIPINANIIIGSQDPVATDSFCARIMGFNPYFIPHIRKANKKKIGSIKYTLSSDIVPKIDFEINKWEMTLFRLGGKIKRKSQIRLRRKS